MISLIYIDERARGLESGRYTGEEVTKFFKAWYKESFTNHDLNRVCAYLGWRKVVRGSGKGHYIYVKESIDII